MKQLKWMIAVVFMGQACCDSTNDSDSGVGIDTTVSSTTPPPKKDTNPIGIMMGDTTIGINDSLRKDSVPK